ncbi:hypothetical protein D3C80_1608610 [compost metagenome]
MANCRGDGTFFQTEALHEAVGMVAVLAVSLNDRDLDDVPVQINSGLVATGGQVETTMFGDDFARHDTNNRCLTLADGHSEM